MTDRDDRREAGPRVVPPPRIRPIRAASSSGPTERAPWWPMAVLASLALLVVATFVLVPRWGDRSVAPSESPAPETSPAAAATPAPGTSPEDLQERARQKGRAEEARVHSLDLRDRLASRSVELWAREEFRAASVDLARGDSLLDAGRYVEAGRTYGEVTRSLDTIDSGAVVVLQDLLAEGRAALAAGDGDAAASAFRLATVIAPGTTTAATGLRRAEVLDRVLARLQAGRRLERQEDLAGAARAYTEAVSLDPMSQAAQEALARIQAQITDDAFARAMSDGLSALAAGDYGAAREAFGRAAATRPDAPQVAAALSQVQEAEKLESIGLHRDRALELEGRESWREAEREHEAVLAIDGTVRFAQVGQARARVRAELAERLDFHITHPDRLSDEDVLEEASELLEAADTVSPRGPRLEEQIAELSRILAKAGTLVPVVLQSDNRTEVTVYQVGRLGRFTERQLELRPGTYTVVGSRRGYRDVRMTLVVKPEGGMEPLLVRCEEKV